MADAMVTARMSQAKKEAGSRILESLGSNASQLINEVYDYLIEYGSSPFAPANPKGREISPELIAQALSSVENMCLPADNRFSNLTDGEIRRERLSTRGLM
jgi:antitoxin component of RelBE/YafQ-DinJ toxin-antitoxin module